MQLGPPFLSATGWDREPGSGAGLGGLAQNHIPSLHNFLGKDSNHLNDSNPIPNPEMRDLQGRRARETLVD